MNSKKANFVRTSLLTLISFEANLQIKSNKIASLSNKRKIFKINHKTPYELSKKYEEFEVQITNPLIIGINSRNIITKSFNKINNFTNTKTQENISSNQLEIFPGIEINQYISSLNIRKLLCLRKKLNFFSNDYSSNKEITANDENNDNNINYFNISYNTNVNIKNAIITLRQLAFSLKNISNIKENKNKDKMKLNICTNDENRTNSFFMKCITLTGNDVSPERRSTASNDSRVYTSPVSQLKYDTVLTPRNDFIYSNRVSEVITGKPSKKPLSTKNVETKRSLVKRSTLIIPKENKEVFRIHLLSLNTENNIPSPISVRNKNTCKKSGSLFNVNNNELLCNTYRERSKKHASKKKKNNNHECVTFTKYNKIYNQRI